MSKSLLFSEIPIGQQFWGEVNPDTIFQKESENPNTVRQFGGKHAPFKYFTARPYVRYRLFPDVIEDGPNPRLDEGDVP